MWVSIFKNVVWWTLLRMPTVKIWARFVSVFDDAAQPFETDLSTCSHVTGEISSKELNNVPSRIRWFDNQFYHQRLTQEINSTADLLPCNLCLSHLQGPINRAVLKGVRQSAIQKLLRERYHLQAVLGCFKIGLHLSAIMAH